MGNVPLSSARRGDAAVTSDKALGEQCPSGLLLFPEVVCGKGMPQLEKVKLYEKSSVCLKIRASFPLANLL